ncbi:MAG: hypothetical protein WB716_10945 [Candidatus Acidiferrales bacterium]
MKVLCIANKGGALPKHYLDARVNMGAKTEFFVTVGKEYAVYGVEFARSQVWFYIDDDCHHWYPIRKPAPLFEVVDRRLSKYWRIAASEGKHGSVAWLFFEEFISDKFFYDRLTNRQDTEVKIFKERRRQMDEEFEPSVLTDAVGGE